MEITSQNVLLLGSILLFVSIITSKTSFRLGIPTLVIFLLIGMIAGSDGIGGINFDEPKIAEFLGVLALNFILFAGGLETKWESVKPVLWRGVSLSTLGVFITAISTGIFVSYLTEFTIYEGLLLGAIVSSTDAAAVFSILRTRKIGLKYNLRPTLELESGSNDPMAYFLTLSLTSIVANPELNIYMLIPTFFKEMMIGASVGYLFGRAMAWVINKIKLEVEGLYPVLLIALMFFTFSFTSFIQGNGFLAVYLSAVVLGNHNFLHRKSLIKFFDGTAWLMQIVMFVTLGLLVFPKEIVPFFGVGIGISLFLIFVARPLSVYICLAFFHLTNREKIFISWVGLRGAVPIVFAIYPLTRGIEKGPEIFNIVFFIALSSVLIQGTTLPIVAKWLHLSVPEKLKKKTAIDLELSDGLKSELIEVLIDENSKAIQKSLLELKLPKSCLIVMIKRGDKFITPNGATVIEEGDKLLIVADNKQNLENAIEAL